MERKNSGRKLPLFCRLLLKLPRPSLEWLPGEVQGFLWASVRMLTFLTCTLFLCFSLFVSFPLNLALAITTPMIGLLVSARIQLENAANLLDLIMNDRPIKWNFEQAVDDYIALLRKSKTQKQKMKTFR